MYELSMILRDLRRILFRPRQYIRYMKRHHMRYGVAYIKSIHILLYATISSILFAILGCLNWCFEYTSEWVSKVEYFIGRLFWALDDNVISWFISLPFLVWGIISLCALCFGTDINDKIK